MFSAPFFSHISSTVYSFFSSAKQIGFLLYFINANGPQPMAAPVATSPIKTATARNTIMTINTFTIFPSIFSSQNIINSVFLDHSVEYRPYVFIAPFELTCVVQMNTVFDE